MKKSFLKIAFAVCGLALLPVLVSAQEKATLAISSIKATPALLASVNSKTVVATDSKAKLESTVFDTKQELNRIIESLDGQLIDRFNATRKFDVLSRSDM